MSSSINDDFIFILSKLTYQMILFIPTLHMHMYIYQKSEIAEKSLNFTMNLAFPSQRDIVANVLRENGVLGAIKAQLRSNVYLALDDGKELRVSSSQALYIFLLINDELMSDDTHLHLLAQ